MEATTERAKTPPVAAIARDILRMGVGGRLPTTMQYQQRLGVGSGTIQKALRDLRLSNAVDLVSRGHQGTFVTAADPAQLWRSAELPPVHILLPPPGPVEAQGVAHALAEQLGRIGATTTIGFLGGARGRVDAVDEAAADVAVVSAGAAHVLMPESDTGHVRVELGPGTYYENGSLVVVSRRDATGPSHRIGIDPHSEDHRRLTRAQFPAAEHEFVETDFTAIPRAVLAGTIDAGIWHAVESLIPLDLAGLATTQLSDPAARTLARDISGAVLVAGADTVVGALLSRADLAELRAAWTRAVELGNNQLQTRMRITPGTG
ncbi:YhfZ family protein [Saccharopolyspora sp. 5N708]|uniref:YhfZ family protein n=1 Tax=Saccharopolyspora sp. 5N708 TaxID=3457424 RepID=UPI003FD2EEDA